MTDFKGSRSKKTEKLPEWVPDWQRIIEGRPYTTDGMTEDQRQRCVRALPMPVMDDDLRDPTIYDVQERADTLFAKREEMRRQGIEKYSDGRGIQWVHPEIYRRAEMKQFRRFDQMAASVNSGEVK